MKAQQEASVADERVEAILREHIPFVEGDYLDKFGIPDTAREIAALWPAPAEDEVEAAESDLADAQLAISVLLRQACDRKTRIAALEKALKQILDAWGSDAAMYPVLDTARSLLSTKEGE